MNNYYKFPINLNRATNGEKLERIDVSKSVHEHIYMLLMTKTGEDSYDRSYGIDIWNKDFDISITNSSWVNEMEKSLHENISQSEKRVKPSFKVSVKVEKGYAEDNPTEIREQFIIQVTDIVLTETNEKINDISHSIIFSPIVVR